MPADVMVLGPDPLTPEDVLRVARQGWRVEVAPAAWETVRASRAAVDAVIESGRPVYGLNTGVGADCQTAIPPEALTAFQHQLIHSHAVNVGAPLREELVRAMIFVRAAGLARGGAGVQPEIFELLVAMLNRGVHPVVAEHGSLGTADLGALSQMTLPLLGLGEAFYQGERLPGAEALRRAGLVPVTLGPKDGLALCSNNALTLGQACMLWVEAAETLELLDVASALSLEGFQGSVAPLDPRVHAAKPHPGQVETAARLRRLLAGSYLWAPGTARRMQDPLSFRCVPQVHGAVRDVLSQLRDVLCLELNAKGDNPLLIPEEETAISNGNFHIPQVAVGFDSLAIALAQAASMLVYRTMKLGEFTFSGLPDFLSARPGVDSGLGILSYTAAHLYARVRQAANPSSLDYLPVSNGQEDHATMASMAVVKLEPTLSHLKYLVALELLAGAQAVDLRGCPPLGHGTGAAYELIRSAVPTHREGIISGEVEAVHRLVASGDLLHAVQEAKEWRTT